MARAIATTVEHWDSGPPFETDGGRVTAVRVACDAAVAP
jgi:hypothetical protein